MSGDVKDAAYVEGMIASMLEYLGGPAVDADFLARVEPHLDFVEEGLESGALTDAHLMEAFFNFERVFAGEDSGCLSMGGGGEEEHEQESKPPARRSRDSAGVLQQREADATAAAETRMGLTAGAVAALLSNATCRDCPRVAGVACFSCAALPEALCGLCDSVRHGVQGRNCVGRFALDSRGVALELMHGDAWAWWGDRSPRHVAPSHVNYCTGVLAVAQDRLCADAKAAYAAQPAFAAYGLALLSSIANNEREYALTVLSWESPPWYAWRPEADVVSRVRPFCVSLPCVLISPCPSCNATCSAAPTEVQTTPSLSCTASRAAPAPSFRASFAARAAT